MQYCRVGSRVYDRPARGADRPGSARRYAAMNRGTMLRLLRLTEECHGVLRYCRVGSRVEDRPACVGDRVGSAHCYAATNSLAQMRWCADYLPMHMLRLAAMSVCLSG